MVRDLRVAERRAGRKGKTAAHDPQRTPVALEGTHWRGWPADESRILVRPLAGLKMLYVHGAAACFGNRRLDTNCDRARKFTLSRHTPKSAFRETPGAKNRKDGASVCPRTRDARADANVEAGSSAQPAAGGQRDADRKR